MPEVVGTKPFEWCSGNNLAELRGRVAGVSQAASARGEHPLRNGLDVPPFEYVHDPPRRPDRAHTRTGFGVVLHEEALTGDTDSRALEVIVPASKSMQLQSSASSSPMRHPTPESTSTMSAKSHLPARSEPWNRPRTSPILATFTRRSFLRLR